MNIQIFGRERCFDTKKAQRYFKERGIPFQLIDLSRKGLSKGELESVKKAVGGLAPLLDSGSKAYSQHFIAHLVPGPAVEEKVLEHPELYKTPIVRNGKEATVGYQPDVWKEWK